MTTTTHAELLDFAQHILATDPDFHARAHNQTLHAMAAWKNVNAEEVQIALDAGAVNVVRAYKQCLKITIELTLAQRLSAMAAPMALMPIQGSV